MRNSRDAREDAKRAHEDALRRAREEYFRDRKAAQDRNKAQVNASADWAHAPTIRV
jgi:hypothetical protein